MVQSLLVLVVVAASHGAPDTEGPVWGSAPAPGPPGGSAPAPGPPGLAVRQGLTLREGLLAGGQQSSFSPLGEQENQCSDFGAFGYVCVPNWQCRSEANYTINKAGIGLIAPRNDNNRNFEIILPERGVVLRSKCDKLVEVCCQHPEAFKSQSDLTGGQNKPETGGCDDIFQNCNGPDPDLPRPRCGLRNGNGVRNDLQRPTVGEAEFGEWPHVCALLRLEVLDRQDEPAKIYECGASLLDDGVVLTAAHCLKQLAAGDLLVRCGEWDTQGEDEPLAYQERSVEAIVRHPDFRASEHHNNFALLFLDTEFDRSDHISPTCLPGPCTTYDSSQNCVAGGFGKDDFGDDGRYATVQKEVVVPLVDSATCQDLMRRTRLGQYFNLHESFVCAGGQDGVDTCQGDGGSPLTCRMPGDNAWFQAGIVSWGIGCGTESPSVYASVATASCWIDQQVTSYYGERESHFGFIRGECDKGKPTQC